MLIKVYIIIQLIQIVINIEYLKSSLCALKKFILSSLASFKSNFVQLYAIKYINKYLLYHNSLKKEVKINVGNRSVLYSSCRVNLAIK